MPKKDPAAVVGSTVGNLLHLGITLWAAVETSGALMVALWVLVALQVVGLAARANLSSADG